MMDMPVLERTPTRGDYPIPDAALDDRLGWIGTAGSGKTYNAGGGVERLLESGARVVIVDPLDVWWGLRLTADGKPSRFSLPIFGGEHSDLPLNENAGKLIGETVANMIESCIVSLGSFDTKAAERRFMLAFLESLYRHASFNPVHLIFDEADLWAPQNSSEPKLQSLMEQIVRRGRVRGFIPWLITQRPAVISKDVLSQVDGLIAFKLTASQDRKAIGDWVKGQADQGQWPAIDASLPTLQRGTGLEWVPGRGILETVTFPPKRTFDSSRTPSRGEVVEKRELQPLDLDKLKGKLASIEEEARANDPKALQAEVSRLKRELAKAEKVRAAPPQIVHANADEIAAAREAGRAEGYSQGIQAAANAIASLGGKPAKVARSTVTNPAVERVAERPVVAAEGLTGPQQRILNALAWWQSFGIDQPRSEQVAFVAGYSASSSGYANLKGALRTIGMIDYPAPGCVSLTEVGAEKAEGPSVEPSRENFHAAVRAKLSGPQLRLLDPLIEAYPDALSSDALAAAANYSTSSSGYANLKGNMRTLGFLDYPAPGQVRAADWLFP